ncbi:MAG: sulfatase-like hydrolase/transferase [Candidatus Competibacteraceae bacterium]|nr:sulfatase-like hydrolase/transferase [Candidatus Competibacteraceae bacterium]MCP5126377.1 sulfatase-like hydrolase/transferase [Gammaproteobacteria bacterium]HRX70385.1 sulfatase-like hydrolase/transferase [Candidatus Competibacteraceae bacterium]
MHNLSRFSINVFRCVLAVLLLNLALTFQNLWPTAGVRWVLEFSLDLLALLLALSLLIAWRGPLGRWGRGLLLGGFIILVLVRYIDVAMPALMGRAIHLYWDSQHVPQVAAMFLDSVPIWQLVLGGLALLVGFGVMIAMLRWMLGAILATLEQPVGRWVVGGLAVILLAAYSAGRLSARLPTEYYFALPVTPVLVEQIELALEATVFRNQGRIAAQSPLPASNLGRLQGGDLLVMFFESYGALVFDDPRFAKPLTGDFAALEQALEQAGWRMASARVESSTFGGQSWLAHSSLLSGLRIADQGDYRELLATDRATLAQSFAKAGYRTVAVMPGLRYPWPEGRFYRFDKIYNAERLNYRGPAYGWWAIPDQYSLYRIHQIELEPLANRAPRFIFFPTINSHAPFAPLPPYQPDWSVFDVAAHQEAVSTATRSVELNERLDGAALAAAYIQSVRYNLAVVGGYLRQYAPPNALLIVLGDHQPPAIVGGRDLSWQTPVHVFSRDPALLERFVARGFQSGMRPGPTLFGGIERVGPLLLEVLDEVNHANLNLPPVPTARPIPDRYPRTAPR